MTPLEVEGVKRGRPYTQLQLDKILKNYPANYCMVCGVLLAPNLYRKETRWKMEGLVRYKERKFCGPKCRKKGRVKRRIGKAEGQTYADYITVALTEWREQHSPLQWPYEGTNSQQLTYLNILADKLDAYSVPEGRNRLGKAFQ